MWPRPTPRPPARAYVPPTVKSWTAFERQSAKDMLMPFPFRYGVEIGSSTSIMGPSIPTQTREVLTSHLSSYNMWALQGIEFVVAQLKSMVLTLGLIDRRLTVEQAVLLSRLEEEYQIQKWGNIEWAHDYELQELRARTAAGTLFVHLCLESSTVKHKLLQE
ncbi:ATP synthase F1 complex assembly factor 2-like protein [Cricetulus griseus]|nr:ATP synthase F1 complex assembly factor 2-like protein [Cricetulus griseus]